MRRGHLLFGLMMLTGSGTAAHAQLSFSQEIIEVQVKLGAKEIAVEYPFTNQGQHPVRIMAVQTSCGCTVAQVENKVYAPGEKAVLKVKFDIGDRVGEQEKKIVVETDDDVRPQIILTLKAFIPELIEMMPRYVFWLTEGKLESKKVTVKIHDPAGIKLRGVSTTNPVFSVETRTIKEGQEYELIVTPKEIHTPTTGVVTLNLELPQEKDSVRPNISFFTEIK